MKFKIIWLCLLAIWATCALEVAQESQAVNEYLLAKAEGEKHSRRRLISVQKTITKIKHHVKRARELRKALRGELEKRHRAIAQKMRKQIEKQREEMLKAHKDRMKKLAEQMAKFRKQMLHHREMEASFKGKLKAMQDKLKKIHGVEMGEDGKFKRMKGKFKNANGNDNEIVAKAVAKAKSRARKRLNKARERMMKVLRQAESPEMAASRKCLKNTLTHMVQVKGHIPHEKDPTDYSDSGDTDRHKGHMSKARDHLTKALKASEACKKIHNGPFHQFGEDNEYEEPKKSGGDGKKKEKEKKEKGLSDIRQGVQDLGNQIDTSVTGAFEKSDDNAPISYSQYQQDKADYEAEKDAYMDSDEVGWERRVLSEILSNPIVIPRKQ